MPYVRHGCQPEGGRPPATVFRISRGALVVIERSKPREGLSARTNVDEDGFRERLWVVLL
jgi:hypothetical protein